MAIDLQIALTILLGGVALVLWGGWWLGRRGERAAERTPYDVRDWLAAWDHAPIALLWLAPSGELHAANAAARTLLNLDTTELGASLPEAEWTEQLRADVATVTEAQGTGRARTVDLPDQRTWHWWVTPWADGALVFIEDVSALQQAEQATHLLLSDLGHELRTPLATLGAHLEVLRLPNVTPETREQSLQFLRDETQRLVRLVNNLLDLGRVQNSGRNELRALPLFPLVEGVVAQLHSEANAAQVSVQLEVAPNLPPVIGQPDRLKQLFLNLLDNSIKYARPGDQVTVRLRVNEAGLRCIVCDTGPGIPAEHLPHVTRRFYRAVPSGIPGSGLGLALAAEILRQHGTQMEIISKSSAEGTVRGASVAQVEAQEMIAGPSGTCVAFTLPVLHSPRAQVETESIQA